ncbi:MAG: gamma-glutamyltransferase [Chromatiales bacterium]|jgi:gamma-glutamyltranspeptidase/glutathione hydrolase
MLSKSGLLSLLFTLLLLPAAVVAGKWTAPPAAAIASAHPAATEAGMRILRQGGNAFDAAVTVTAVLAVAEPYSSGIGGGGFYLLHKAGEGLTTMLDARERAPFEAARDMYLDSNGEPTTASLEGPLSAGIPGIPAALVELAIVHGRLPLQQTLQPAIEVAREGFAVDEHYRRMADMRLELLQRYPQTAAIFLHENRVPPLGHVIRQPDLARTLSRIASYGNTGFYSPLAAGDMVEEVRRDGGIWSLDDLAGYRLRYREPVTTQYHGWQVTSAAPPSSGGIALATMFGILSHYDLKSMSEGQRYHHIIEAMRHAYRDRAEYLGDPDHIAVPVDKLLSEGHIRSKLEWIRRDEATPSASLPPVPVEGARGTDTTHFSILDGEGNRVSATLSINYPFGSGYVIPGTGILLNDEMDDFSAKPGSPNAYGLVGAEANAIAPGKRPLSSMSPTFLEHEDKLVILGTPGGSRIITMVLLGALEAMRGGTAEEVASLRRLHHQYLPDRVAFEEGAIDDSAAEELILLGHELQQQERPYGDMQVVIWDREIDRVDAASDPRGAGSAAVMPMLSVARAAAD